MGADRFLHWNQRLDNMNENNSSLKTGISVVIPSWNGIPLLRACLPSVRDALKQWGGVWEIIVVDDAGSDGTPEYLAREHPDARCECLSRRGGFVAAVNRGLEAVRHEFCCLLNNDMTVAPDFFIQLMDDFRDGRVFAVSAKAFETGAGKLNIGQRLRRIENNEIQGIGDERDAPGTCYTYYASGGASMFRTRIFRGLGGLDSLFAPFYVEDADLSYRAWKRGWIVLFEPGAVAHHIGSASMGVKNAHALKRLLNKFRVAVIIQRNAFLFLVKNITDPDLWAAHKRRFFTRWLLAVVRLQAPHALGLIAALPRLSAALRRKRIEVRESTVPDRQVFEILNSTYTGKQRDLL